jgi:leader peptidase (prepilin peptidase)/N-methyltransferase
MSSQPRVNWPLMLLLTVLGACFAGYVFGEWLLANPLAPPADSLADRSGTSSSAEIVWQRLCEFLAGAWVFAFGASVGSFLNVVVYRVPRGLTLLGTSHCPRCGAAIRPYHNVPVFGWFWLRGRCCDCALPISPRYPVVEAIVGLVGLLLVVLEVFGGGRNLPEEFLAAATSAAGPAPALRWDLMALSAYHGLLLAAMFSWALIHGDGFAVPRPYFLGIVAWGLAMPFLCPSACALPLATEEWFLGRSWLASGVTSLSGFAVGGLIGWLAAVPWAVPAAEREKRLPSEQTIFVFGTVGLYLGWQVVISAAALTAVLAVVGRVGGAWYRGGRRWPLSGYVFFAALLQICLWRQLAAWAWWPGPRSPVGVQVVAVVLAVSGLRAAGFWRFRILGGTSTN